MRQSEPTGRYATISFVGERNISGRKRIGNPLATTFDADNDTPALNALKALRGAPTSMGRGEIPVELQPAAACPIFCVQTIQKFEIITAPLIIILESWCCFRKEAAVLEYKSGTENIIRIPEKRTYTVKEIADILGIGKTAAYKLVHTGVFKTVQIGTTIRVSRQSFDEWLDKQT